MRKAAFQFRISTTRSNVPTRVKLRYLNYQGEQIEE